MRTLQTIFGLLLIGVSIALGALWSGRRSRAIIDRWATENRYEVVSAKSHFLAAGPFTLRRFRGQTVYRIHIRDANGRESRGWVRCGGWLLGILSDDIKVQWD